MAQAQDLESRRQQERNRREDIELLDQEAAQRKRRIEQRKKQKAKAEAARKAQKRNRMAKMAIVWAVVIAGGFMSAAWFSEDFGKWVDQLF